MTEPTNAEIRAWARANGHVVADRGRIPAGVVAAYTAEHGTAPADLPEPDAPPAPDDDLVEDPGAFDPLPDDELDQRQRVPWTPSWGPSPGQAPPPPSAAPPAWGPPPGQAPPGARPPAWGPPPGQAPPPGPGPGWGASAPGHHWDPAPPSSTGREGFAIASLILGIIPFLAGLLGIIFGFVALRRIRSTGRSGRGMAIAGIILGTLWLTFVVGVVIIGALGEADRADDGTVTSRGSVTATDLRVGDCPSSLPERVTTTLQLVPCSQPHRAEVYSTFPLAGSSFPGDAEVARFGEGGCVDRLPAFVGPARVDAFDVYFLHPTDQSWRLGDRKVHCLLTAPDGGILPGGTAKGP